MVGGHYHAPAALHPGKRPSTRSTGGWLGLGASLDVSGKCLSHQASNPGLSRPQQVAIPSMLPRHS